MPVRTRASETFIAVGSNVNPSLQIPEALRLLSERVPVCAVSTFYQTKAIGRPEQPDYRNGVFKIEADMSPLDLKMHILRDIERQLEHFVTGQYSASHRHPLA